MKIRQLISSLQAMAYVGLLWLAFSTSGAAAATLALNGVASYQDLNTEYFLAGLYLPIASDNTSEIFAMKGQKRMEMRVTFDDFSPRKFAALWRDSLVINNSPADVDKFGLDMLRFSSLMKGKLVTGDQVVIDQSSSATVVSVNGNELARFSPEFFPILLRTWIGPRPASSDFKRDLLTKGAVKEEYRARYSNVVPLDGRKQLATLWTSTDDAAVAEAKADEEAKAQAEADAKSQAVAEAKAKAKAEAKAEAEVEEAKAQAEAKAKAETQAKAEAEARTQAEAKAKAEAQARAEAEAKAQAEAKARQEEQVKLKAEAQARADAEAKAKVEAQARAEAEAKAKAEAAKATEDARIAALKASSDAKAKADAEALAKAAEEARQRADQEAKAREAAEAQAKLEEEARQKAEAQAKADAQRREVAEAKAKLEEEARQKAEAQAKADAQARAEAEAKAKADAQARADAEAKAKADAQAKADADAKAEADERRVQAAAAEEAKKRAAETAATASAKVQVTSKPAKSDEENAAVELDAAEAARELYKSKLVAWVYKSLEYPEKEKRSHREGNVQLKVTITRDGKLVDTVLVEQTKYPNLNLAAKNATRLAQPYPPMPKEIEGNTFEFVMPILFRSE